MAEAAQFQEARRAPARRWLRWTAAALAGAPLLAGFLQTAVDSPAQAAEQAAGPRGVDVAITSMTPTAPAKDDTITVTGSVTNHGSTAVENAHVALRLGAALHSRSAIDTATRHAAFSFADGQEVGGKHGSMPIDRLPSGVSRSFSLSVPAKDLHLGGDGVYQMGVSLTGQPHGQQFQQVLGIERSFLPWQPKATSKKTQISYLWPLISSPHVTAQTDSDPQQTPMFRDDRLADELKPGGRLQQLVTLGKNLPVTWVIDPDLLASVDAMTENYKVESPTGPKPGKNQAVAKKWLKDVQDAVESKGASVVALPFGDPDLASLAHRGKDVYGALGHLKTATDLAGRTVETIIGTAPRTDFAWPAEGAVDASVVDVATSAGAHHVITRNDSMREPATLPYTPNAARPIGSGNTAIVADAKLSTAFRGDMSRAENSTLSVQEFLAQTLMITMQDPGSARSIVVAPQRMPTASQAQTMSRALQALDGDRWTEPMDLTDAAKAKPDPGATRQLPSRGAYPRALRGQELATDAFEEVRRTQKTLEGFQVILSQRDRVVPFGNAIRRELSTSWRGRPDAAKEFRGSVQGYLVGLSREVQLIQKSTQTLSGRSATIPVTVQNNLVQGVEGLKLVLTSSQPNRVDVGAPQPVKIEGGHSQSVKFATTANANGPVRVQAQLYAKDGTPYGAPMTFKVTATSITSTVMLVIAGGVLLLVLAGIRMYTQRKRAAAGSADADADSADDSDAEGEDGAGSEKRPEAAPEDGAAPEQEGDAAPDTGPDGGAGSGPGEKVNR